MGVRVVFFLKAITRTVIKPVISLMLISQWISDLALKKDRPKIVLLSGCIEHML